MRNTRVSVQRSKLQDVPDHVRHVANPGLGEAREGQVAIEDVMVESMKFLVVRANKRAYKSES